MHRNSFKIFWFTYHTTEASKVDIKRANAGDRKVTRM